MGTAAAAIDDDMRVASPIGGLCSGHTMRGAVLAAILGGAQVQAASLSEALSNATFYHTGTAHATDGESAAARPPSWDRPGTGGTGAHRRTAKSSIPMCCAAC